MSKYLAPFVLLLLVGCATQAPTSTQPTVKSWLDPVSMATITAQSEPLVLARRETRRTINGRDYAQLVAIEVNRMGERHLYLIAVLWSNAQLTTKQWRDFETSFEQVEFRIDDRSLNLTRLSDVAALGIGESPMPLPIPGARQVFYPIQRAELQALAESQGVALTTLGLPEAQREYEEREDGRRSLSDFLAQLPGEATTARR